MYIIILVLGIVCSFVAAYTINTQKTTFALGRLLLNMPIQQSGPGLQDAITPKLQTTRNIIMFALLFLIFGITTYSYAWYHGLWVVLVTFISNNLMSAILGIKAGSPRLVKAIHSDLKRRHKKYLKADDSIRAQAMKDIINRLENLDPQDIIKEASRFLINDKP